MVCLIEQARVIDRVVQERDSTAGHLAGETKIMVDLKLTNAFPLCLRSGRQRIETLIARGVANFRRRLESLSCDREKDHRDRAGQQHSGDCLVTIHFESA